MREKNRLEAQINQVRRVEMALADQIGMVELAELEGEEALVNEALGHLKVLKKKPPNFNCRVFFRAKQTEMTPILRLTLARAVPRRAIGRECSCACMCAGLNSMVIKSPFLMRRRVMGRDQINDNPYIGRSGLWLAQTRIGCAPPCAYFAL